MHASLVRTLAIGIVAVVLSGCTGGASQAPVMQPAAEQPLPLSQTFAQSRARGNRVIALPPIPAAPEVGVSWMASEAKASSQLLYVADQGGNTVSVFSYPEGKPEGVLTGFDEPSGLCTDREGNVYVLNGNNTSILVYAHGGTQILRILNLPGYPYFNCSVDQKTGDLPLGTTQYGCPDCPGFIVVFHDGSGTATKYQPPNQTGIPGCAYDDRGNLFCIGFGSGDTFKLYELPRGTTILKGVTVNGSGLRGGAMQWDGKYLAFADASFGTIKQLQVSGYSATVVGSTTLNNTDYVWEFWIPDVPLKGQRARIIAPTYTSSEDFVGYWDYPAGGNATKTINGLAQPDGVTLSVLRS